MSDCPDIRGVVLDAARLSEIRDLLTYESSISFHSNRAHESMWLLHTEVQRLTAELALKDQALDEIKALAEEWRSKSAEMKQGDDFVRARTGRYLEGRADDIQRILTRLDTQGETK